MAFEGYSLGCVTNYQFKHLKHENGRRLTLVTKRPEDGLFGGMLFQLRFPNLMLVIEEVKNQLVHQ